MSEMASDEKIREALLRLIGIRLDTAQLAIERLENNVLVEKPSKRLLNKLVGLFDRTPRLKDLIRKTLDSILLEVGIRVLSDETLETIVSDAYDFAYASGQATGMKYTEEVLKNYGKNIRKDNLKFVENSFSEIRDNDRVIKEILTRKIKSDTFGSFTFSLDERWIS